MAAGPDPLAGLRGLHLPAAVQPHGSGGLLAAAALGLAAAVLVRLLRGLWPARGSVRSAALAELAAARSLPDPERVAAQAALLRRLAVRIAGPAATHERGEAWLARLDALKGGAFFRAGPGRVFGDALYRPGQAADAAALDRGLAPLLRRLRR